MAADVSSTVGYMKGYKDDSSNNAGTTAASNSSSKCMRIVGSDKYGPEKSTALVTRDLLGGLHEIDSQELDLDLQVPSGWEKRLDLKSGKIYLQRCNLQGPASSSDHKRHGSQVLSKQLEDLNFPPSTLKPQLNLFEDTCLDLKLMSPPPQPPPLSLPSSCGYESVCTLDKVKSALEKAEREPAMKKRSPFWKSSPSSTSSLSPSNSSSSSSIKESRGETVNEASKFSPATTVAAGCPSCLLYVLICKSNPKCPRCNAMVPFPGAKRPRIDLNMSI